MERFVGHSKAASFAIFCIFLAAISAFAQTGAKQPKGYVKPKVSIRYSRDNERIREAYEIAAARILTEANKYWAGEVSDFRQIEMLLTENGRKELESFLRENKAVIVEKEIKAYLCYTGAFIEVRDIPIILASGRSSQSEVKANFIFLGFRADKIPKLEYVKFDAPSHHNYEVRFAASMKPDSPLCKSLNNFIRKLEKAYNDRDMKYLRQVYLKTAEIIVGKDLPDANPRFSSPGGVDLISRATKVYLDSLESKFKNPKTISVRYDTLEFWSNPQKKNGYAVEIFQIWCDENTNYSDSGWVTLHFEIDEKKKGFINIRTWLQEKQLERRKNLLHKQRSL